MHAGNGAAWGTTFFREELTLTLFVGVFQQRNARVPSLLRTIVNQSVFANVQVARAGAATPIVFEAFCDVVLELIDARKRALFQRDDFFENLLFARSQRL